ncbi:Elongation factor G [Gemmata obscuriglobus]|uniref:Elongation factor G n=1 Tax=Gemmata obscuriglobus TaxID=114 RepID=A0A2Z3GVS8_9BACT|nr:elongation factor G [Gemmata obscuriglobus]AWM36661.1 elongation factor G [Gemmata obscuriglobus]QEG30698.1 Elongation factor G [Gemmata obscuriglobus]VTS10025.1 translation elongation factor g : Elongation factor G OS=Blastopirellula marina DSM 3645 GN=DSM3645_09412 PE=3 SV=1: GTP_EFTU: GTP_EFTU_D2: EFG_II: EFG_IV: EFG_C [Gemmata obscuriglobus UQM 2246]
MAKDKGFDLTRVRNLGVIAHIDAGKTTTTEHLLFYAAAKHKLGGVDEGTTDTDYDPEEQARGITIYSACVPFEWAGHTINLIDTPGHVDFTAEVERSLRVLDGAVVVFDGQKGVEAQSETVWRQANRYGVPRLVFVNKMDVVGANFARTLESVNSRLTPNPEEQGRPVPIVIPIGSGGPADSRTPFGGVIDLIEMKAKFFDAGDLGKTVRVADIPEDSLLEAQEYREKLFDALTAHDEKDLITSVVLDGKDPDPVKVRQLVREQCLARKIYPVLAGSGREHIGIQPLLDAVTLYLPSPFDRPPVTGTDPKGKKEQKRKPDPKEPFCGLVFKAAWHPSGNRFFVRVYSGVMKPNMRAFNPGKDAKENVAKLFHVHADPARGLEEVESGPAGDIVCVVGLKDTVTGDTLCETSHPILLEAITFAEAVVSQSIEPESGGDKDKLALALEVLQLEDPTFKVRADKDTGQTLMSGMGTLHLEVKRHRLERDFRLKVRAGKPRVSYREMLKDPRSVDIKVDRLGDKPAFAELKVSFTNFKTEKPVGVFNAVPAENPTPVALLAAAEKTLADLLQTGEMGYPMMNAQARIIDAKFDPQLSTEDAFINAAVRAYRQATEGNVQLLEPIMKVTVSTPLSFVGNITGDMARRRAQIESQDTGSAGDMAEVVATVPLSELFTYANEVRSLSQGRAAMSMEPHSYAEAPASVLKQLLGE